MHKETVLGLSTGDKAFLIIIPPILGAILGWFLPTIAGWIIKLPFIPFQGVLEWLSTLESPWVAIITASIGAIAGIIFTLYAFSETLSIRIKDTEKELWLKMKGKETIIHKNDISAIYLDRKKLVILDTNGAELYRETTDTKKDKVKYAFNQHGYPWKDNDPFANQYHRWVANHPDLSAHINTLLAERERALKDGETDEAKVLRKDLAVLGIVLNDDAKRQYFRKTMGEENA